MWSGLGYREWSGGQREENLERAVAAYERSAESLHAARPIRRMGMDPGRPRRGVYRNRIRGDRADNLEKAIAAYEAALTVRTREATPHDWALTQNNLGDRLREPHPRRPGREPGEGDCRLRGRRSRCRRARPCRRLGGDAEQPRRSPIRPHPRRPGRQPGEGDRHLRGGAHGADARGPPAGLGADADNLGIAYVQPHPRRPGRQPGEGHRRPRGGAHGTNARGPAARLGGDAAQPWPSPMRTASAATGPTTWRRRSPPTRRRSRCVRARPPQDWATTQNNLGIVLSEPRPRRPGRQPGEGDRRLEAALTVRTREALPQGVGATHSQSRAGVRSARIRGERADNLEKAIAAFEAGLTVRTREALPQRWAKTQNNLAPPIATASAASAPTTWRRRLPPTRQR